MASHETTSVAVFPTNLQSHGGSLVKDTTPLTLPPPANSVQHLACSSTSQSPAVNVVEKAYSPHNLSPAKTTGICNGNIFAIIFRFCCFVVLVLIFFFSK